MKFIVEIDMNTDGMRTANHVADALKRLVQVVRDYGEQEFNCETAKFSEMISDATGRYCGDAKMVQ